MPAPAQPEDAGEPLKPGGFLVVDDDAEIMRSIALVLRRYLPKAQVHTAASVDEALACINRERIDVVISDFRMPGRNGLDLVTELRSTHPRMILIMMTAYPTLSLQVHGLKEAGIDAFFSKPFEGRQMADKISSLVSERA